MSFRHWIFTSVCVAVTYCAVSVASAAVLHWSGGDGSSTDLLDPNNWVELTAPANDGTDELHFGAATFTTVGHNVQLFLDQVVFDVGAPAYTFTENPISSGADYAFFTGTNRLIVNNSSTVQSIGAALNLAAATIQTPGAGLEIHGEYVYANGSSNPLAFNLTNDVTINTVQFQNAPRNVYGANGTTTTPADPAGTLFLNVASGTGNTSSSNFTGQVNIWSGAVRIADGNALGRASTNTFIHGTYVASTSTSAQLSGDHEHGFGRLELTNNISSGEAIRIDSRLGDVADYDQIVNVSGDNTLTNINAIGGGGHFNFRSDSGTMTLGTATDTTMHISDPGQQNGAVVNSIFTFRGAGNIVLSNSITATDAGLGTAVLRKQGSGTLTMNGFANGWDGGTLVEGGTLIATGSFSTTGPRVHVAGGATLDLSAIGGLSLNAGKTLSGAGTVVGNVTTFDPTATISPGGAAGFDANDLLTVTASVGSLAVQNDLNLSSGGTYEWKLGSLSTTGPGTNFDQLVVGGNVTLGGASNLALDFSLLGGSEPNSGDPFWSSAHSWTIIDNTIDAATTNFATIANGSFTAGHFTTSISGGDIVLNYVLGGNTPGDFNGDGNVDGADFALWQNSFPTTSGGTLGTGDADGDGDVDGADFIAWQTHYPTSASPTTAVPEPQSCVLFGFALAGFARVCVRRKQ